MDTFQCRTKTVLRFDAQLLHVWRLLSITQLCCWVSKYRMKLLNPDCTLLLECVWRMSTQNEFLMWRSKQPVDGARPYSTGAQTDERSAQCLVCFPRAAGGNVSRGPWLGEAGCPGFLRSSLAPRLCIFCPPLPLPGASETHSPLRLFGLQSRSHSGSCRASDVPPE